MASTELCWISKAGFSNHCPKPPFLTWSFSWLNFAEKKQNWNLRHFLGTLELFRFMNDQLSIDSIGTLNKFSEWVYENKRWDSGFDVVYWPSYFDFSRDFDARGHRPKTSPWRVFFYSSPHFQRVWLLTVRFAKYRVAEHLESEIWPWPKFFCCLPFFSRK